MREESGGGKETGKKDERKETAETAPSQQSDLLRSLGGKGHPRGNFTDYCNYCFNLGEQYLKQYMLKKRGYK